MQLKNVHSAVSFLALMGLFVVLSTSLAACSEPRNTSTPSLASITAQARVLNTQPPETQPNGQGSMEPTITNENIQMPTLVHTNDSSTAQKEPENTVPNEGPTATVEPTVTLTPTPEPFEGSWKKAANRIDALTGKREVSIALPSSSGWWYPALYLQCRNDELEFIILWGERPIFYSLDNEPTTPVQYRIDDEPIKERQWPTTSRTTILQGSKAAGMIRSLYNAEEFVVRATEESLTAVFRPSGIYWAVKPVLEACSSESSNLETSKTPAPTTARSVPTSTTPRPAPTRAPTLTATPLPTETSPTKREAPCCISVGSAQVDITALLGEPDYVQDWGQGQPKTWDYSRYKTTISVEDANERVVSWDYAGPLSESPFQVLRTISAVPQSDPDGHLSVGSTAEEVVSVIGEPDSVQHWGRGQVISWGYYNSSVVFDTQNERVVSWDYAGPLSESPFQVLRTISAVPQSDPDGHLSVGSTAEEVVSVIGEPDSVQHWGRGQVISWGYYNSSVVFDTQNERVTEWHYDGPEDDNPFQ